MYQSGSKRQEANGLVTKERWRSSMKKWLAEVGQGYGKQRGAREGWHS